MQLKMIRSSIQSAITVNLFIAGRKYPMKVKAEEEASIRAAGKMINHRIQAYKESTGIQDKQDLLAMVAFDLIMNVLQAEEAERKVSQQLDKILKLIEMPQENTPKS